VIFEEIQNYDVEYIPAIRGKGGGSTPESHGRPARDA
jgi:hypothetical protein